MVLLQLYIKSLERDSIIEAKLSSPESSGGSYTYYHGSCKNSRTVGNKSAPVMRVLKLSGCHYQFTDDSFNFHYLAPCLAEKPEARWKRPELTGFLDNL